MKKTMGCSLKGSSSCNNRCIHQRSMFIHCITCHHSFCSNQCSIKITTAVVHLHILMDISIIIVASKVIAIAIVNNSNKEKKMISVMGSRQRSSKD